MSLNRPDNTPVGETTPSAEGDTEPEDDEDDVSAGITDSAPIVARPLMSSSVRGTAKFGGKKHSSSADV